MGCGPLSQAEADEAYRRIQVAEARVAHGLAAVERCEPGSACPASEEVCAGADEVCRQAQRVHEADARERCEAARRSCAGVER
ncbi:MAG: hypothetical protein ACFCGT_22075 [Sandaracinaceae bacterium]